MYDEIVDRCERYALIGRSGRRWYRVARSVIRRLAQHGTDNFAAPRGRPEDHREHIYRTLCDLVALTSPRCSVTHNLRLAWGEFTRRDRPADMTRSTRAALEHYYRTGEIRGPKTSRFARVLRGDENVVVVDTWIARAIGVKDKNARTKASQSLAERVVSCVQDRLHWSTGVRWTPAETQAAIWCGCIRTFYKNGKVRKFRTADVGLYRTGRSGTLSDVPF